MTRAWVGEVLWGLFWVAAAVSQVYWLLFYWGVGNGWREIVSVLALVLDACLAARSLHRLRHWAH